MPRYEVTVTNNKAYSAEIEVEADNEDDASEKASQLIAADKDSPNPEIKWLLEEDDTEIDDITEITEEDDENEDDEEEE